MVKKSCILKKEKRGRQDILKEWENEILEVLEEKAKEQREIKFYDAAFEMGYTHVNTNDVKDIASEFVRRDPTYRKVRSEKDEKRAASTESLFTTLVLPEEAAEYYS